MTSAPVEPPRSRFVFSSDDEPDDYGRVAVGGDLAPGTLLAAYRNGLFPMNQSSGELTWWSPDPRGVLPLDKLRVSRSLSRSMRRFEIRVDTAFEAVMDGCAREGERGSWITPGFRKAYLRLHRMGWAHSVESWSLPADGEPRLVGGLYGVAVAGLFAGESMFHRRTDASKAALAGLVALLRCSGYAEHRLLDVQWWTPHLGTLGTVELPRAEYLRRLRMALVLPQPRWAPAVAIG